MKHNVIGIDLAKNTFQICALNQHNKVVFNKKVSRLKFLHELRQLEPTIVVMESCYSANHWGRTVQAMGHDVKLIPPYQVKPFLVGNKNDSNDALAIAEAASRPKARFVPIKTLLHQDVQSLQRIRERYIRHRTAVYNQMRGLLSEYGVVVERSISKIASAMPWILEDAENDLTMTARHFLNELREEGNKLSERIKAIEKQRDELLKNNPDYL